MVFDQPAVQRFIAQARKHSYRPRQLIARSSETSGLFLILEGAASMILEHETGNQAVLGYLFPGDFFGEWSLDPRRRPLGVTVRARGDAVIAAMGIGEFTQWVGQHPDIALVLAAQLAARLERAQRQIADHFFFDVTERLSRALREQCQHPGADAAADGTWIRINRQELAFTIGCSREMVARALKTLENKGTIRTEGHSVLVRAMADAVRA